MNTISILLWRIQRWLEWRRLRPDPTHEVYWSMENKFDKYAYKSHYAIWKAARPGKLRA